MDLLRATLKIQAHEAWSELIRRLHPAVASSVLRTLRRFASSEAPERDLVDDLVQQTYVRLCENDYRALRHLVSQEESSLLAYVRTVAVNLTIDYLRTNRHSFEPVDTSYPEPGRPIDHFILIDTVDRYLQRCTKTDAARDRRVFWLYYQSGLTSKAIAELADIGLSQKGIESLLERLARCVRQALATGLQRHKLQTGGQSINAVS
jgi:RNA polymerase sigma-70 factor, ECF subfamily